MASDYMKNKYSIWEQISAEEFQSAQASMSPNEFWNNYQQSSPFGYPVFYQKRSPDDAELLAIIADRIHEDAKENTERIQKEVKKIKEWVVFLGALSIAAFTIFFLIFWSEYIYWWY